MNERKIASYVPVTRELLDDAPTLSGVIDAAIDKVIHPWRYADRNPMPSIDLYPRLTRFARWLHSLRDLRVRLVHVDSDDE